MDPALLSILEIQQKRWADYFDANPTEGLGLNRPSDPIDRRAQVLRGRGYSNHDAYLMATEEWQDSLSGEGEFERFSGARNA